MTILSVPEKSKINFSIFSCAEPAEPAEPPMYTDEHCDSEKCLINIAYINHAFECFKRVRLFHFLSNCVCGSPSEYDRKPKVDVENIKSVLCAPSDTVTAIQYLYTTNVKDMHRFQ